jgi:hypothetical protein
VDVLFSPEWVAYGGVFGVQVSSLLVGDEFSGNDVVSEVVFVEGPSLCFDPGSFDFGVMLVDSVGSTSFDVWNCGLGVLSYELVEGCGWVELSSVGGVVSDGVDTVLVEVDTSGLVVGELYVCEVGISSDGGVGVFEVSVFVVDDMVGLLDVNQSLFDLGFRLRPGWNAMQEFVPSYGVLSRVELYMTRFASPSGDVTFEIREGSGSGSVVFEGVVSPGDVPAFPTYAWVSVEVGGVVVVPGETYVVVLRDAVGASDWDCLLWGFHRSAPYGSGGPYTDGWFWFQKKFQPYWFPATDWDYTFKTYGI